MMSYTCNFTQHEISNLRIRKDIVKNALRSSLRVFKDLFILLERTSLRIKNGCVKMTKTIKRYPHVHCKKSFIERL